MNNVISGGDIRKGFKRVFRLFEFFALLFGNGGSSLAYYRNFSKGEFKTGGKRTFKNKNRSGGNFRFLRKSGVYVVVQKVGGKSMGGSFCSAKNRNGKFAVGVIAQIFKKGFKVAAPMGKRNRAEIRKSSNVKVVHASDERIREHRCSFVKNGNIFGEIKAEFFASGKEDSFFKKHRKVFVLLALKILEHLFLFDKFRRNNYSIGEIIKKGRRELINKGNIAVGRGNGKTGFDSLKVFFNVLFNEHAVLAPLLRVSIFEHLDKSFGGIGQNFPCGGNESNANFLCSSLAFKVEGSDRIRFVSPKFNSNRVF